MQLRESWKNLRTQRPQLRARDAAAELGVTEAELVASGCGDGVVRLSDEPGRVLERVRTLGPVMALTRNAHCVHERRGTYTGARVSTSFALVVGPDIDLRVDLSVWQRGFAVTEGDKRSLQFFDAAGTAVHKIHLGEESDIHAFEALVRAYTHADQSPRERVGPPPPRTKPRPDADIDVPGLRESWHFLQDTHDFQAMLDRLEVQRLQALRLAGPERAVQVPTSSARQALTSAAALALPIMVFVGNPGCLQIHTGPVEHIKVLGPWLNVLDHHFNLHLREDALASAWVVRKPTKDGVVTALELYDAQDELVAQLFGQRKPGTPELRAWRTLAEGLV